MAEGGRRGVHAAGELGAVQTSKRGVVDADGDGHGGRIYGQSSKRIGAVGVSQRVRDAWRGCKEDFG